MNRISEIMARLSEIRSLLEGNGEVDLEALQTEMRSLQDERTRLETRQRLVTEANAINGQASSNTITSFGIENREVDTVATPEYRQAFFKSLLNRPMSETEQRAFDSTAGSAGAVIPTVTLNEIFTKISKLAPMLDNIRLLRVKGNVSFAMEGVRGAAALHAENAPITPSTDTLIKVTLSGFEVTKVISISKTVQTMTINAFESWLTDILAADIARALENLIINGTGTAQSQGIAIARTWDATSQIAVATGVSVDYLDIINAIALLPSQFDLNAKFLMNKKSLYRHIAGIVDLNDRPIMVMDTTQGLSYNVMGFPVIVSDFVPNDEIYFGDFETVVGNLSEDITVASSAHSGFLRNAVDFLGSAIFDSKPAIPEAIVRLKKTP